MAIDPPGATDQYHVRQVYHDTLRTLKTGDCRRTGGWFEWLTRCPSPGGSVISVTDPLFHVLWLSFSTVVTAALAVYGFRHRQIRGSRPFTGLMCSFALFSLFHLLGLLTENPAWRLLLNDVRWTWTALLPLFWLWFALEYTGYDELTASRAITALSAIPAATILLVWTNDWHGLMWTHNEPVLVDGLAVMDQALGSWFWLWTAYMYACGCIGAYLLVRLVWSTSSLFADQSTLLVVGVAAPMGASVVTTFELVPNTDPAIDLAPYAFALTGLCFGYALYRHRLFDIIPATTHLGRNTAVRQLEDGLVIVDAKRRMVYCNPTAASILDCEPEQVLGTPITAVVTETAIEFCETDALAEIERDGRTYEVRSSPITDRRDRLTGHTLVIHDVTERKRRERQFRKQRDELETISQLNAIIRGVNQALLSATTSDEIFEAVCEQLADSDQYDVGIAGDVSTWRGTADRWTTGGTDRGVDYSRLPELVDGPIADEVTHTSGRTTGSESEIWVVVPVLYHRTIYGAVALRTSRERVTDRERAVLDELGELIGHAISAVENRQFLSDGTIIEAEFESTETDAETVLGKVSASTGCRIDLDGFVRSANDRAVAYLSIEGNSIDGSTTDETAVEAVRTIIDDERPGDVRVVPRTNGLLEWTIDDTDLLYILDADGLHLKDVSAVDGRTSYTVEFGTDAALRRVLDRLPEQFPGVRLTAKRAISRSVEPAERELSGTVDELTERQREALEAAYRAGYFEWPRASTAEEVAESLGISAPTLHAHLRKAERAVTSKLFDLEK